MNAHFIDLTLITVPVKSVSVVNAYLQHYVTALSGML